MKKINQLQWRAFVLAVLFLLRDDIRPVGVDL